MPPNPTPGKLLVAAASLALALTGAACGASDGSPGRDGSAPASPGPGVTPVASTSAPGGGSPPGTRPPATPGDRGPRPIPATIVELELAAFPRPADEACAGHATTVDVASGESIASAVDAAEPGTTIRVAAGTYVERPDEWVALEVATSDVCLRAAGGEVVLEAVPDQSVGISLTGDDVVIDGLVLRGFRTGIAIDGRDGETQRGLVIERTRIEDLRGDFREGIVAFAESTSGAPVLDGLLLLDVVVAGSDLGVSCNVGPCEHLWVEGSRIGGRGASDDSGADAFAVEEGRQVAVVDSVFEGASGDGIDMKASDVVVFGARLFDLARNGVKLWRGGDVINTIIDGTGADASLVGEEPGTYRYLHVLVAHHGEPGEAAYVGTWSYDVRSSEIRVEIVNSIFWENGPGGFFIPEGAALSIRNSLLDGSPDDSLLHQGDGAEYALADLAAVEAAGFGGGNRVADPMFVDPAGRDYSTEASSPARDAGERIDGLDVDAAGNDRARGGAPDIGPLEG